MRITASAGVLAMLVATVTVAPAHAEPPPTCQGQVATIEGTDGDDDLEGTPGPDVVWLGDGNDQFDAGDGNDVVCGGPGHDILFAGGGDDLLDGGAGDDDLFDDEPTNQALAGIDGADQLLGGEGDDRLELKSGDGLGGGGADDADGGPGIDRVSWSTSPTGVVLDLVAGTATGGAEDTLAATEGPYDGTGWSDTMLGTPGSDVLRGGDNIEGSDVLRGRGGDDELSADGGRIVAGPGDDVVPPGGDDADDLVVDLGRGDDGVVVIPGRGDYLGGPGHDVFWVLDPEQGHDFDGITARVRGGKDDDLLSFEGFHRRVRIDVADGRATTRRSVIRFAHVDEVHGSSYDDTLSGSAERDLLRGLGGDDVLRGWRGRDRLRGGQGHDAAHGGAGRDTCSAELRRSCERHP